MTIRILTVSAILFMGVSSIPCLADGPCQEGREVSTQNEQYCLVEKDGKEVKHGVFREFHPNGNRKTLGEFSYGNKTGTWTAWADNGTKVLEEGYLNGLRQGPVQKWYVNGQIAYEGHFEDDKPVGERLEWYMNGSKMARTVYTRKGENIHALRSTWFDNGKEASSATYINGKLDGLEIRWHKNGRKRSESAYSAGQKNGPSREWYPDGKEKSSDHYNMGKKEGSSIEWYDNGQKKAEGAWKNGRDGRWTYWEKDGSVGEEVTYKAGKRVE